MNRKLLLHGRLAPPRNHDAYLEVLNANPRGGCIKVFDAAERKDRYVEMADVLADIHDCKLTVLRAGKPRFSHQKREDVLARGDVYGAHQIEAL
jgi:putative transposase